MSTARDARVLMVASAASGQGKTTWTAGLARHYRNYGRRVRCMKIGPDFLDPSVLAKASAAPVLNLDTWMGSPEECARRIHAAADQADVVLIEAMMGLYDGEPCAADLARALDIPVLLVIDAGAMAQTFGAVALGLSSYRALRVWGVGANGVASPGHATMLEESLPPGLPLRATLPRSDAMHFPERHLGLVHADELEHLDACVDAIASHLHGVPEPPHTRLPVAPSAEALPAWLSGMRIGVARDDAFCFVYPANLLTLSELGASVVPFSPCHDRRLPEVDALYLPGGYPELSAQQLSGNGAMREEIAGHVARGKPTLAECGGLMYLARTLQDQGGERHAMVGALQLDVRMQPMLAAIGHYQWGAGDACLRGHAFHRSICEGVEVATATARPRRFGKPEPIFTQPGLVASYVHWYFPSNPARIAACFGAKTDEHPVPKASAASRGHALLQESS